MKSDEGLLLTHLKNIASKSQCHLEIITEEELVKGEAVLGFPLPELLRRIYLEIGEGAFGLTPLYEKHDRQMPMIESYLGLRSEPNPKSGRIWPEKLLIIYDWGCNIYSCLDCSDPDYRVFRNDNNKDSDIYTLEAPSLRQWLERLIDDRLDSD